MPAHLPHPALRVPVRGDGAGAGDWEAVHRLDGLPILFADGGAFVRLEGDKANIPLSDLPFEDLCVLARYLPLAQGAPLRDAIGELLATHAPAGATVGVEAGCGVGADLPALASVCEHAIGFDGNLVSVRVAQRWLAGTPVPMPIRHEGHRFSFDDPIRRPPVPNVTLVCGDALDPPLHAGSADVVMAINLLDNVPDPALLLGQLDALLKPGGVLLLASPFSWQDTITPPARQLGGSTSPAWPALLSPVALDTIFTGGMTGLTHLRYKSLAQREVPWALREHDRCQVHYQVHLRVLEKLSEGQR